MMVVLGGLLKAKVKSDKMVTVVVVNDDKESDCIIS